MDKPRTLSRTRQTPAKNMSQSVFRGSEFFSAGRLVPILLLICSAGIIASQVHRPVILLKTWLPWIDVGCLAIAMTPVIMMGGIDLSVASQVALHCVGFGLCLQAGWSLFPAISCTLCVAVFCGFVNGGLVARGRPSLLVTLATMALYRGFAMSFAGAEPVRLATPVSDPDHLPVQYIAFAGLAFFAWLLVHRTTAGRWILAVGENRTAARISGVPDRRLDVLAWTTCGLTAGLVAVMNVLQHNVAIPDSALGAELQAIACVIVGGTLITGGRGGMTGTLLGIAVVSTLDIALQFLSTRFPLISVESRMIVTGILLISVAVSTQNFAGKRSA
ncbi:MAG: ABC transporter permease [Planctomycetaceae bacterium]